MNYYTSVNEQDLIDYDNYVSSAMGLTGSITSNWSNIVEHKDGGLFAIAKCNHHPDLSGLSEEDILNLPEEELVGLLNEIPNLDGWYDISI